MFCLDFPSQVTHFFFFGCGSFMECDSFVNWAFTLVNFTKHWTRCYNSMWERERGEWESERGSLLYVQTWNQFMCKGHRNHSKIMIMCSIQLGWNEQLLMLYSYLFLHASMPVPCMVSPCCTWYLGVGWGPVLAPTILQRIRDPHRVWNLSIIMWWWFTTHNRFLTVVQHTNSPSFSVIKWIAWLVTQRFLTKWKHQQPSLWRDGW